ncbi:MAG: flavin-containing monooxygenase [Sporichthyaceae bacterium]
MSEPQDLDILIVGAGLSGVGAAVRLRQDHPDKSLALLEARDDLGGTWDLFRYPGVRSDTDAYTMGYGFRPWVGSKSIAGGGELLDYIRAAAVDAGVDRLIRYRNRVTSAQWSSTEGHWRVSATCDGEDMIYRARFLYICAGYYDYARGHQPDFPGLADYEGTMVYPQFWPADLDYAAKRVVVIGSGATAVTLIPAMAPDAAHVTMLQRSPTYMLAMPETDKLAVTLQRFLPAQTAHRVIRAKNVLTIQAVYGLCRWRPQTAKKMLRETAVGVLKDEALVDEHFTPAYDPWDQRLCLIPSADLFKMIRSGAASVVTDHIDTFVPEGIRLRSGKVLEADIVVSATGLTLLPLGGIEYSVDGNALDLGDTVAYRAMLLSGVPNLGFCFGYSNNSWTLRAELSAKYLSRLIAHMDSHGYDIATPTLPPGMGRKPFLDLTSGYVQRGIDKFPSSGTSGPWLVSQNYLRDIIAARRADPGEDMVFTSRARVTEPVSS